VVGAAAVSVSLLEVMVVLAACAWSVVFPTVVLQLFRAQSMLVSAV
jgi:hypothetical protein